MHAAPAAARAQDTVVTPSPLVSESEPRFAAFIDATGARVHYEGFLPSAVIAVAPYMRLDTDNAVVVARASLGRFEGGNLNSQALIAGGLFSPVWHTLRGEAAAQLAIGNHQSIGSSGSARLTARLHAASQRRGAWLGGGVGWSSVGGGIGGPARSADVGGWFRRGPLSMSASIQPSAVIDLRYVDYEAAARVVFGRFEGGAEGGFRTGDRTISDPVDRRRMWGSIDAVGWVTSSIGVTAGWGTFLADPGSSTIGGRYASIGIRWSPLRPAPGDLPRVLLPQLLRTPAPESPGGETTGEALAVAETSDGALVLRFTLPGASSAELMADFTDWEPVQLSRTAAGTWEFTVRLTPGVHRLNLRVNRGEWRVPPGLTAVSDGYGGQVGLLIVRR